MNWFEQKILSFFVKTKGVFSSPILSGNGLIFMLHRVLPENERALFSLNQGLAISPEKLEEFILLFKNKGFRFISMNELNNHFENGSKLPDKFICFTLDDGYKDSLTHGLPIFKKHQVPFTIYITNCFPNGTAVLWWYLFESHAKSYNELIINSSLGKMKFNWQNETEAFEQFRQVSEAIKSIPATELNFVLSKSFKVSTADLKKQCKNIALSWNDIIQLSKEPLVTIGAHTMNHISVKQQSASIVEKEMKASKLEIEQYIGMEVIHFAYPFGSAFDVSKRDIDIAFDAGYKTSTLNQPGNIFRCNKQSRNALARMPLGNQTDSYRMENYMNGIYHYSVNGFKRNIY